MTPVTEEDGPHVPTFSIAYVPSPADTWPTYRKKVLTHAVRINGPFRVETSEGMMTCQDGYLATDARGYPYPIAKDEFDLIYEQAGAPYREHTYADGPT